MINAADLLEELIKLGKIAPASRVDLAKSCIGVAIRAGRSFPVRNCPVIYYAPFSAHKAGLVGSAPGHSSS